MELLNEHHLLVQQQLTTTHEFAAIAYNSRLVVADTLFFCKGNFQVAYLKDAQEKGATMYISEVAYPEVAMDYLIVSNIQKAMSLISAAFFGYPNNQLQTIAFTGTKGKTTAAYFTKTILDHTHPQRVALFSTVNTTVGNQPEDTFKSSLTTPESLDLLTNMNTAVTNGLDHLIMEVSSQAYKKQRVYNLKYDVGVFLNISRDHIGKNEHPNFEDYFFCKKQLLVNSRQCVINADTDYLADVYAAANATSRPEAIYLYQKQGKATSDLPIDFKYESLVETLQQNRIKLVAVSPKAKALNIDGEYQISIPGDYNEGNAVAAAISAALMGASVADIQRGLDNTSIPGRMESYPTKEHGTIYVDYAHNYASLHSVLSFLKEQSPNSKVYVITGSAGDKGIDRRPGLGKAIGEAADVAYLTTDDPASEDPQAIAQTIWDHVDNPAVEVHYIADRKEAILTALERSVPGDTVLVAGKGQDAYQIVKGKHELYDGDSQIVEKYAKGH